MGTLLGNQDAPPKETDGVLDFRMSTTFTYSTEPALSQPLGRQQQFMVSLIPGVNMPLYAIGYYLIALFFSAIIHEAGHALSAASERVPVQSVGIFFYVLYPGAFVDLEPSTLAVISPINRLRIICAGVWHNAALGLMTWLLLATLPLWLAWGYVTMPTGVVVLSVKEASPLSGHVASTSVISAINGVEIRNGIQGWQNALYASLKSPNTMSEGYCIPLGMLAGGCFNC
ncbi:Membrane-bound transcription factor site-2 protease [Borealophlyctis nickersoniae]|nr:Membrane-bound transcription factor site-2 protease [Borealophlyctis nickersoniae]